MRPVLLTCALVGLSAGTAFDAAQDRPTPEALAVALQERYQGIRDFSADFTHVYRGVFLPTETREAGRVLVKKPGRMRWIYSEPERKEVVATGDVIYIYDPRERLVHELAQDDDSAPALFLAGEGDLVRDFMAAYAESPVEHALALQLTPRRPEPGYDYFVVAVDPDTLQIRAMVTVDAQGGESTLVFTNLRENRGISDREFEFQIPRGVEVIRGGVLN